VLSGRKRLASGFWSPVRNLRAKPAERAAPYSAFVRHKPLVCSASAWCCTLAGGGRCSLAFRYDAEQTFRVANPAYVPGSFEPR